MKTQEQKLQHVVESAGECWFRNKKGSFAGVSVRLGQDNPSPDDLNELFRLTRNTDYDGIHLYEGHCVLCSSGDMVPANGETDAEALLNALFIATGGKDGDK